VAKILVVESEGEVRRKIVDTLIGAEYETLEASDGREGLALFLEDRPDLVFTAMVMPHVEGLELIAELRRRGYDGPIIAISDTRASRRALYLRLANRLGANDTLAEPFSASELLWTVERLLPSGEP
jgi:two-component system response regulator YesN